MCAHPDLLLWERVDILWGTLMVAVEHDDLGERFDDAVAGLDGLDLRPIDLVPVQRGLYVYRAYGRIEQARAADEDQRARRLGQARDEVKKLGKVATTPVLRAHHALARASLLQAGGHPAQALRALGRSEPERLVVDAPGLSMEAARVRALALTAQGAVAQARREARHAVSIAAEQGWPHRVRRLSAELDVSGRTTVKAGRPRTSDGVAVSVYRQRLEAIEQVSRAAAAVLDPARIATVALDETIRILGAERAFLFLVDEDDGRLLPFRGRDAQGNDVEELTGYSATLVERVRRSEEPLVVTGTDEGEALGAESVVLHGLRSIIVAPIVLDGRLIGVAYLDSRVAKGIFTVDDLGTLATIINHVGVAFETARAAQLELAVAAANDRRDLAETMRDGLAAIAGSLEPEDVLRRLLATIVDVGDGGHGWLVLGTGASGPVRIVTAGEGRDDELIDADGSLDAVLALKHPQVGDGDLAVPALVRAAVGDTGSWMAVPLWARDEHLGVLVVAADRAGAYGDDQVEIAAALVGQGMVAYESARLFERVQELAAVDGLTGLANRRHFFDLADRQVSQCRREGLSLAAMMIDVDHFKAVNDRFGHRAGDEVLAEVAARLLRAGRTEDVVGRYGGEEFAVLASSCPEGAAVAAERLRAAVSETPVPTTMGPIPISVSIGIAELTGTDDVSTLLARADDQLYEAKRAGRNRISAAPLP
jgi:diguanylate cyclase (GGDEF)-like protein